MAAAARAASPDPHIPVLLRPLLDAVAPVEGVWIDGTLGAGGYARGLLEAGAEKVIGIDRDPLALEMAQGWAGAYGDRVELVQTTFSHMDEAGDAVDGVAKMYARYAGSMKKRPASLVLPELAGIFTRPCTGSGLRAPLLTSACNFGYGSVLVILDRSQGIQHEIPLSILVLLV